MAPLAKKASTNALPTKERALFTRLIQEYETKKHKAGLKTAETILKKFPEHGETLCMKGLLLASLDRRIEGLELAKQGVRFDLTSFIAWHALGILHRMSKNYSESIKCYLQALKIEGGSNVNLIRESAYLYVQLRDWSRVVELRSTLVRLQPHLRMSWIGLILALHLGGDIAEALRVTEQFELIHRDVPKSSYEQSELYLYHAQMLFEAKRYQDALDYLEKKSESEIVDRKSMDTIRANCSLKLDAKSSAEKIFESLIAKNQEDRTYLKGWLSAKGVATVAESDSERKEAIEAFEYLSRTYPTSRAVKRLALVYVQGETFRTLAQAYIGAALQKGIPSIFTDVKSLYGDVEKCKAVEEIVEQYRTEWQAEEEVPSSYLWAIHFLAQHYSFLQQSTRAMAYIDSAIAHSPTVPELHMTRARIVKQSGSLLWASHALENARLLDGQDRFLNSKSAKYLLRIGQIEEARQRVGLFTKPDAPDPVSDLVEMQATWYLLEEEKSFGRLENYAMALKRCGQIEKIFSEIWDDQLDFHSYCLRKVTLRSYVNMVRWEDVLQSHPAYFHAATDAVAIYIKLHDTPTLYKPDKTAPATNGHTSEQRKKAAQKAKKQEKKALEAAEAAKKAAAAAKANDKKGDEEETPAVVKDEDPTGESAFAEVDPLRNAQRYLSVLQNVASNQIKTWLLTFEVAIREKNWLLATKAIAHAHMLDSSSAQLHVQIVRLKLALPSLEAAPAPIGKSIDAVLSSIIPNDTSLLLYNSTFIQRNPNRADVILAGAKAGIALDASTKQSSIASILEIPKQAKSSPEAFLCNLSTLIESKSVLMSWNAEQATLDSFDSLCHQIYPMADNFKTQKEKDQEDEDRKAERNQWDCAKTDGEASRKATNGSV
ncbi:hypothetical protein CBS101457_000319 [Exobasidium rhododendri]|nr:hypothetical protein CBS101457_000319 [Exobasidium rhododendri]